VEVNPGSEPCHPRYYCIIYANIRGLRTNLNDLSVTSHEYDVIMCSDTLVSDRRHVSELCIPGFSRPVQIRQASDLGSVDWLHMYVKVFWCIGRRVRMSVL
jgi:hypothetical protein